jgi:hypothetical protein
MAIHYIARLRGQFLGTIQVKNSSDAENSEKSAREVIANMLTLTPADPEWPCTKDHKITTSDAKPS